MTDPRPGPSLTYRPLIAALLLTLLWLVAASPVLGVDSVPSGAQQALAPVTRMIGTLVAIAIGAVNSVI